MTRAAVTARFVHQVARPQGRAAATDFAFVEAPLPPVEPGGALVENLHFSVDPYMREVMDFGDLHAPMEGRALGRVVESRSDQLKVGDLVAHRLGWRTHALLSPDQIPHRSAAPDPGGVQVRLREPGVPALRSAGVRVVTPPAGVPLRTYLSLLGGTGLTAYVGLTRIARLQPGESLYVSAAAGGVGTAVGQLARLMGVGRLVGSTGSAAKVRHLTERLGFDAAFDHHDGPVGEQLRRAAPDGLDVYFDNVGGDHLAGAIDVLRDGGRIAWCGAVAQYDDAANPPAAPYNLYDVVSKSLRLEGFLVRNHREVQGELEEYLTPYLRSGVLVPDETVTVGFDRSVDAFLGMLAGANTGKAIVQVGAGAAE
ncbi:NADP-dependent oxidoreductase [Kitasatospora sp. NBC_00070]|uniref:NADP-dependent oxidoreductase n=1 Tax=Kitasatospora sp. NBC_00070 TaxID=2975962 RepID=UPI003250DCB5